MTFSLSKLRSSDRFDVPGLSLSVQGSGTLLTSCGPVTAIRESIYKALPLLAEQRRLPRKHADCRIGACSSCSAEMFLISVDCSGMKRRTTGTTALTVYSRLSLAKAQLAVGRLVRQCMCFPKAL